MNNSKQRSLLEAVDSIVNKRNNDALYAQITEAICYGLQDFEDKMGVELTEEQEKLLTQIGFDQCMNRPTIKQIDLSEDVHTLINENTPEEVFSCIMEEVLLELVILAAIPAAAAAVGGAATTAAVAGGAAATTAAATAAAATLATPAAAAVGGAAAEGLGAIALRAGTRAAATAVGRRLGRLGEKEEKEVGENGRIKKKTLGEAAPPSMPPPPPPATSPAPLAGTTDTTEFESEDTSKKKKKNKTTETPNYGGTLTTDSYGIQMMTQRQAEQDVARPQLQESIVKHKKKLFKITFMDKGMKKKGTAVSHKGVMRIVNGKSNFKVYDEKNHDVTSQFRGAPKK